MSTAMSTPQQQAATKPSRYWRALLCTICGGREDLVETLLGGQMHVTCDDEECHQRLRERHPDDRVW